MLKGKTPPRRWILDTGYADEITTIVTQKLGLSPLSLGIQVFSRACKGQRPSDGRILSINSNTRPFLLIPKLPQPFETRFQNPGSISVPSMVNTNFARLSCCTFDRCSSCQEACFIPPSIGKIEDRRLMPSLFPKSRGSIVGSLPNSFPER